MVFAVQGPKDRSEIEMTLELKTLWFDDLKKQDPQTSKNKYIVVQGSVLRKVNSAVHRIVIFQTLKACSVTCRKVQRFRVKVAFYLWYV